MLPWFRLNIAYGTAGIIACGHGKPFHLNCDSCRRLQGVMPVFHGHPPRMAGNPVQFNVKLLDPGDIRDNGEGNSLVQKIPPLFNMYLNKTEIVLRFNPAGPDPVRIRAHAKLCHRPAQWFPCHAVAAGIGIILRERPAHSLAPKCPA